MRLSKTNLHRIPVAFTLAAVLAVSPTGLLGADNAVRPAAPGEESEAFQRGFADGQAFGAQVGQKQGYERGRRQGFDAGFEQGMDDERTGTPPPGGAPSPGDPPPPPPPEQVPPQEPPREPPAGEGQDETSSNPPAVEENAAPVAEEEPGEMALRKYPDLMPRGSVLGAAAGDDGEDPDQGMDYTKGFASGFALGFGPAFAEARKQGYSEAYPEGYEKGRAEYRRLHRREDGSVIGPRDQIQLGRQAMLVDRYDEAIRRFDIAIAAEGAGPYLPEALYWKARAYHEWDKGDQALAVLGKLLSQYGDSGVADDGYLLAGAVYENSRASGLGGFFGRRRWADAANAYNTLVLRYPDSPLAPRAYFRLGHSLEKVKRKDKAIAAYRALLERFPQDPLAEKARERLRRLER